MRTMISIGALLLGVGCAEVPENEAPIQAIEGLNSLYMGHSYFRKQAEAMQEYAEIAGIEGHQTTSFFHGGYKGSAAAIWEDVVPGSKANVEAELDAGDIQMFGMTLFVDADAVEGDLTHPDSQVQGMKNWIEYARERNPDTIFFIALPWLGGPLTYVGETGDPHTSGYLEYEAAILDSEEALEGMVDELRETFTDSEIFLNAYGQGSLELRTRYNQGNLPDVDTLVSDGDQLGIHSDTHGHAEQLLTDLNTLIWMESLYGYNVLEFEKEYSYETDIKAIAHEVAGRQNPAYNREL